MHSWPNVKKNPSVYAFIFILFHHGWEHLVSSSKTLFVAKKYRKLDIGKKLLHEVVAQNEQQEITHVFALM